MRQGESLPSILRRHGLRLNTGLGQHFLSDEKVLHEIAHSLEPSASSEVVEVGAGIGNLTYYLALSGAHVAALELDRRFHAVHHEIFEMNQSMGGRVKFCYMDALEFDYAAAAADAHSRGREFLITGNIPYQITSPLVMRVLESGAAFNRMVLMMQREVADRLAAKPGTKRNGGISIKVQYYCDLERIMEVPRKAFIPPPEVESTVLRFVPKKSYPLAVEDRERLFALVDAAFAQRRKMLSNSVAASALGFTRERVQEALSNIGLRIDSRAEALGLDEFVGLFRQLHP